MQPYTLWVKVIPVHLYSKVCVCGGGGGKRAVYVKRGHSVRKKEKDA